MKHILQSLRAFVVFTLLVGVIYPLVITAIAQVAFHNKANGSLITRDGGVVGSALLAQRTVDPRYFWPRPSAGDDRTNYATIASAASNKGPTSSNLVAAAQGRAADFRSAHHLAADAALPGDMVFASGSGLDPHISPEAANSQVARVAAARGLNTERLDALVQKFTEPPTLGFMGQARVNVLLLNLALDEHK
jgi:K+-transporting ATPase ATPase C chain